MINPFVICSIEEQRLFQQYAEREAWELMCRNVGATTDQCREYGASILQYAHTTPYSNQMVVNYLRSVALRMMLDGKSMPLNAQAALDYENEHAMQRIIGRLT